MTTTVCARGPAPRVARASVAAAALAAVFFAAGDLRAQPVLEASAFGDVGRLTLGDAAAETQSAAEGRWLAGYVFDEGRLRLTYDGEAGTLGLPGDWAYAEHRLAAVSRLDVGQGAALFAGLDASLRDQGADWGVDGHRGVGGFLRGQWTPRTGVVLRGGWRTDRRTFADVGALDHLTHDAFASVLLNFPTRTTLIAEAHHGWKTYEGGLVLLDVPEYAAPGGGRGRGSTMRVSGYAQAEDVGARLVTWLLRAGQSLDDRTGLSLQWTGRQRSGDVPPALVAFPPNVIDDGIYDDPFASDGHAWRLALKRVVGAGGWIEASGAWSRSDYVFAATDAAGTELSGSPLRRDEVTQLALDASLPLAAGRTGAFDLAVRGGYAFVRRTSNDAFYPYRSHVVTLGLTLER